MLMLMFYLGDDRYTLDSKQVIEVIPRVALKPLHHAPECMPGLFNYRSHLVPVIDLCHLIRNQPCRPHLSSRIILINYQPQETSNHGQGQTSDENTLPSQILGLMVERVTGTFRKHETEVFNSGIQIDSAPYLGEMIADDQGMIQCLRVNHLLPESQRNYLLSPQENLLEGNGRGKTRN